MKTFKTVILALLVLIVGGLFAGCSGGNGVSLDTSLNCTPLFDESLLTVTLDAEEIADGTWTFKGINVEDQPYTTGMISANGTLNYSLLSSEYVIVQKITINGENVTAISGSDKSIEVFDDENKEKYKNFNAGSYPRGESWEGNTLIRVQNDYKFTSFPISAVIDAAKGKCTILTNDDRTLYKISEKKGSHVFYFAK